MCGDWGTESTSASVSIVVCGEVGESHTVPGAHSLLHHCQIGFFVAEKTSATRSARFCQHNLTQPTQATLARSWLTHRPLCCPPRSRRGLHERASLERPLDGVFHFHRGGDEPGRRGSGRGKAPGSDAGVSDVRGEYRGTHTREWGRGPDRARAAHANVKQVTATIAKAMTTRARKLGTAAARRIGGRAATHRAAPPTRRLRVKLCVRTFNSMSCVLLNAYFQKCEGNPRRLTSCSRATQRLTNHSEQTEVYERASLSSQQTFPHTVLLRSLV